MSQLFALLGWLQTFMAGLMPFAVYFLMQVFSLPKEVTQIARYAIVFVLITMVLGFVPQIQVYFPVSLTLLLAILNYVVNIFFYGVLIYLGFNVYSKRR